MRRNSAAGIAKCLPLLLWLAAAAVLPADDGSRIVVMLGDSTTLCGRNKPAARIPDLVLEQLKRAGYPQAVVINAGKGSDSAATGCLRLQADVLAHRPDVVTISFGLNDALLLPPANYEASLEKIIMDIRRKSGARILLVTSTPFDNARYGGLAKSDRRFQSPGGLDGYLDAEFCARTRKLARQHGLAICDLHAHFQDRFKEHPELIGKLIMADGVHLTDEGNTVAAEQLGPMIAALLRETKQARPEEAAVR